MSETTGITPACAHCGDPCLDFDSVVIDWQMFHSRCVKTMPLSDGILQCPGPQPIPLTEADVRRIVREELEYFRMHPQGEDGRDTTKHDALVNNPWAGILDDD